MMTDPSLDEHWMRQAITLADLGAQCGEVPVGAVVVYQNRQIGHGWNRPIASHDPSAHAEILALREAGIFQGNYRLPGVTLYVTLEPCLMCVGAILHARIARLVFGAYDPKTGAVQSVFPLLQDTRHFHQVAVTPNVLGETCKMQLSAFFQHRRAAKKILKMSNAVKNGPMTGHRRACA